MTGDITEVGPTVDAPPCDETLAWLGEEDMVDEGFGVVEGMAAWGDSRELVAA